MRINKVVSSMALRKYCGYGDIQLFKKKIFSSLSSPTLSIGKKYSTDSATLEITKPYVLHKLDKGPSTKSTIKKNEALTYFRQMQVIRRMEGASASLYKEKAVRGFCHLYAGEEAVAIGIKAVLRDTDTVITAYRAHGWVYIMGVSPFGMLAELAGRQGGCARSKGGSMHMYGQNFFGGNGIVGAQVPLGTGLAFAHKHRNTGGVSITLYGDGAANQGQVFEAFNIAKLWSLPCVYICENNGYGMGTAIARHAASTAFYTRGDYIPGIWVDGMDLVAVKEATKYAIDYCTSGKGPIILEAATYRYYGHSMSDPGTSYRSRDEIQKVRQTRDPIASFREKILKAKLVSEDELKKIEKEAKKEIDEAAQKAKADKELGLHELSYDLYALSNEYVRNVSPFAPLQHKVLGNPVNLK